jgi:hypothetical protein
MELCDMNLTEIIAATQDIAEDIAESPTSTKITMSLLVLLYLLGRDTLKYLVPLLKEYLLEQNKLKLA